MNRLFHTNLFALCFIVFYFLLTYAISLLTGSFPDLLGNPFYTTALLYVLSFGIPSVIYACILKRKTGQSFADTFGFHKMSGTAVLLTLASAILVQPTMMLISSVSQLFFQNVTTSSMIQMAQMPLSLFLLTSALLPAFFEELVCRGVILSGYRETPFWYALLIPALFFGLLHLNFQQILYAVAGGVFFALLVKATGSLWSSVLAHLTINGLQSLLAWAMVQSGLSDMAAQQSAVTDPALTLLGLLPIFMLVMLTLPLLVLCLSKLFQKKKQAVPYAEAVPARWHRGAWLMYAVLGFLFVYALGVEVLLRYA